MRKPSPKIMSQAQHCEIINLQTRKDFINDELYLIILADVAASKGGVYRVLIFRSKTSGKDWSSCNCIGCQFTHMCKHIWAVEMKEHNKLSVDYDNNKTDS